MEYRILVLVFLVAHVCFGQGGRVVGVKDGDTIEVLVDGKAIVVRFEHVDCPEIGGGQPYSRVAKEFVSDLCFGKEVKLVSNGTKDRYGRLIAVVLTKDGVNVNLELVKNGLAWHYKRYSSDAVYADAEILARTRKVNIWRFEGAVAPWEWGKRKRI
ncbi:thermonuclease family protein [Lacihabitans soyangensis]|uniref:Nuclease n=1 Tax=Lacihabitans soyangensis TaxID=869394 RepID=A0AAE3H919_9BACT|nr:thermonuclease family protein [Lacihabitans soyangensis]MCP9765660.1 nuclease [Lacihabitans soyangensis]